MSEEPADLPAPATAISLWRHRDFMWLWSAETTSQVGTHVTRLALPLTAILVLDATAFQVGALNAVEYLPFLLVGLPAGVWVDRLRRRPILIAANVGRAAALLTIPVAYTLGLLTIGQLYAVAFFTGALTVFFDVAYLSYLPSLVGKEHLVQGNSKLEISRSTAQMTGPAVGGGLIDVVRAPAAIILDAASYVVSALFLWRIRRTEPGSSHPDSDAPRSTMWADITEGFGYVGRHRLLRCIAASTATSNLFDRVTQVVLLVFAVRELKMAPSVIGLVFSLGGGAALVGAVLSSRLPRWVGVGPTLVGAMAVVSVAGLVIPFVTRATAIPLLVAWASAISFGTVVYDVTYGSLRQAITPERLLGRMNATMRFIVWGTIPLGSFLGGVFGSTLGLRPTLVLSALGGLTALLPLLLSDVRTLQTVPNEPVGPLSPDGPS